MPRPRQHRASPAASRQPGCIARHSRDRAPPRCACDLSPCPFRVQADGPAHDRLMQQMEAQGQLVNGQLWVGAQQQPAMQRAAAGGPAACGGGAPMRRVEDGSDGDGQGGVFDPQSSSVFDEAGNYVFSDSAEVRRLCRPHPRPCRLLWTLPTQSRHGHSFCVLRTFPTSSPPPASPSSRLVCARSLAPAV
eukprot:1052730-Prymnesium_polylepis.1